MVIESKCIKSRITVFGVYGRKSLLDAYQAEFGLSLTSEVLEAWKNSSLMGKPHKTKYLAPEARIYEMTPEQGFHGSMAYILEEYPQKAGGINVYMRVGEQTTKKALEKARILKFYFEDLLQDSK
jgi:hypothetical protein